MQKIALVTGASSGFGKDIALELDKAGYYVFAAARRLEKLREIASDTIEPMVLDVTKEETVKAALSKILSTKGKIDLLVNNAGHGLYSTVEDAQLSDIHHQFDVNVFGAVRMMQAVLPSMREKKSGMIINISSVAGQISMPLFGFYSGSKHALEAICDALRMETTQFGIKTVIVEPGIFRTNFRKTALDISQDNHKTKAYDKLVQTELGILTASYKNAPNPILVAELVAKIANKKNPKRRYVIGKGSKTFLYAKKYFGYALLDNVVMKVFGAK